MTDIYLVRHGTTQANKDNRFAGRTNEELHAEGIEQIRQVGERLIDKKIAAVYCGPARRTVQSAEIFSAILAADIYPMPELDEINIPHWDGLTKDEIRQKYGREYPDWLESPETFRLPGCEHLEQVQNRAVAAVKRLQDKHPTGSLLLVSHLIVLRCLVLYYKDLQIKDFRSIHIANGSILKLSGLEDGGMAVSCPGK